MPSDAKSVKDVLLVSYAGGAAYLTSMFASMFSAGIVLLFSAFLIMGYGIVTSR
jgi:hypothetical protein